MAATAAAVCTACTKPLTVDIHPDDDDEATTTTTEPQQVPDDVQLQACGCHFHWQCLLDSYEGPLCPKCRTQLAPAAAGSSNGANDQQLAILVNLHNEGGVQTDVDIADVLCEEAHLRAHPSERRARAFLEFCRAGDASAIVELLRNEADDSDSDDAMDEDDENDADATQVDILRYQDPLDRHRSGLHCAVLGGSFDVAWLLLYMASQLPLDEFPEMLRGQATGVGLVRESLRDEIDIRGLRDGDGQTAEDVARSEGGAEWAGWLGRGRLSLD